MSAEMAFVGDVHGNLAALQGLWDVLGSRGRPHAVFLGDYINKGVQSAGVMHELLAYRQEGQVTLLKGNHEVALLEALDSGDLAAFLKMGGAMTIRSYVGGKVGPDVLRDFRANFPSEHLNALHSMAAAYESGEVIARHEPVAASTSKFLISAHVPVGDVPRIEAHFAQLDTGCGVGSGRLTALLWPSRDYVQVDADGVLLPN